MLARLVLPLLAVLAWPAAAHGQAGISAPAQSELGDVTVGGSSPRVYLPVTNTGDQLLDVAAVTFDPPTTEFDVLATDCADRIVPVDGSCFLGVRFTPAAEGVRTAMLLVAGDQTGSPSPIELTGRGVAAATGATGPQGPTGQDGATGAAGPAGATGREGASGPQGATGPQGRPGRAIQATCTTRGRPPKTSCRIVVLPDETAATAFRVRLLRAGKTVARGNAARAGRVRLRHGRRLRPGRYTLAVRFEADGRTVRARERVRLR
jgi:hypothetical protein